MKITQSKWSLYNSNLKTQIDGLDLDEAREKLSGLPRDQLNEWTVWREDQVDWHEVTHFPELIATSTLVSDDATLVLDKNNSSKKTSKITPESFELHELSFNTTSSFELNGERVSNDQAFQEAQNYPIIRKEPRFSRSYRVTIRAALIKFECMTIDVSRSGIRLDRELPQRLINLSLECEISWGLTKVKLICRALPEPKSDTKSCYRLMISRLNETEALRLWQISAI